MRQRRRQLAEDAPAFRRGGAGLREIPAAQAKTHLAELLDAAERGESIVITRHGRAIARLVPDPDHRRQRAAAALDAIKALGEEIRREHGSMSLDEILSLRHEGHKY